MRVWKLFLYYPKYMKTVRRRIRRHFGLTAKQVAVRSQRPWYVQGFLYLILVLVGFLLAYWRFDVKAHAGLYAQLDQALIENQALQTRLINVQSQLQVETATKNKLAEDLVKVQDERLSIKAEVLFYKNMLEEKKSNNKFK